MTNDDLETVQCNLDEDCKIHAQNAVREIELAESCETVEDAKANLQCALECAETLVTSLREKLGEFA